MSLGVLAKALVLMRASLAAHAAAAGAHGTVAHRARARAAEARRAGGVSRVRCLEALQDLREWVAGCWGWH